MNLTMTNLTMTIMTTKATWNNRLSRLTAILLLCLTTLTVTAQVPPRPDPPKLVNDFAGILGDCQWLEDSLQQIAMETSNQICIVTMNDFGGLDKAQMAVIHSLGGHQETAAIDLARARDTYILLLDCKYERCPACIGIADIVPGVERTQEARSAFDVQGYVRFQVDGAAHEIAALQNQASASVCGDVVDGRLQYRGVEGLTVGLGPEVGGKPVLGAGLERGGAGEKQDGCKF